ncbi:MAG: zinc-ribbon domain-containing protein [Oscillospiraceae bacterium]|nr:zinc-ribbon domain-containing protein [Oscillospiraceae bacterium]
MFCSNCGREIGDNAKFCNFCGLPVSQPFSQPVSRQISQPISESISQPIYEPVSEPISEPISVVEAVENTFEPISESAQAVESVPVTLPEPPNAPIYSAPQPENIPNMGEASELQSGIQPQPYQAPPTLQLSEKPMPERKYTLGHIIMCLAAVAVMAIVAGIFAGLYFGS